MKKTLFIVFLLFSVVSCEKDNPPTRENQGIPLIVKVLLDGELYYEYSYNKAGLICEEKNKLHYTKHFYNTDNQLIRSDYYVDERAFSSSMEVVEEALHREEWVSPANTLKSLTISFEYDDKGQLIRKSYTRPGITHSEYLKFSWEEGKISRMTMFMNDELRGYTEYYYDARGNLIREEKHIYDPDGNDAFWASTEYEFDNMNNPYLAFKQLKSPGKYTNPNNILRETYKIYDAGSTESDNTSIIEYSYEYNKLDYPVRVNGNVEYVYQ